MAIRPVFVVLQNDRYYARKNIEFTFFSGFSDAQKNGVSIAYISPV